MGAPHVDDPFREVVNQALVQYRRPDDEVLVDAGPLVAFARWAGREIERATRN